MSVAINTLVTSIVVLIPFSNERKWDFLNKQLILAPGKMIYKMNLRISHKSTLNNWGVQSNTGAD